MLSPYEQFENALHGVITHLEEFYMVTHMDTHGEITYTNDIFLTISKWTPKRVLGKTFWQMFPQDEKSQEKATKIWTHLLLNKPWSGSLKKMTRTGDDYYVYMTAIPIVDSHEKITAIFTFEQDITSDIRMKEKLETMAFIDFETGLMNRPSLETTTNDLIEANESFSFVYLMIDQFYTLHDFQSNDSRKEIIKAFTNRLKRYFQNSKIARIGVNEFVVITQFGNWFIDGFNEFLSHHPIHIDHSSLTISVSGGMIRFPTQQSSYISLMTGAMTAAKQVSEIGGGTISTLSEESYNILNRQSIISNKLPIAIKEEQLQVVYQPQYSCQRDEIILYEALIRWEDEELGTISPDELIPIAEKHGFIKHIGTFVLNRATELASQLNRLGQPTVFSINLSVLEFMHEKRDEHIMDVLRRHSCPPDLIQFEITETFAFKAEEELTIIHQMQRLKEEGIEFALDDFGTGYASFRYMNSLPITKLKIDKEFIDSLTTHHQTKQLIHGMIQFAKSMNMFVIAEGVETKEQHDILKELGIHAMQGYFIGPPISKEEILSSSSI